MKGASTSRRDIVHTIMEASQNSSSNQQSSSSSNPWPSLLLHGHHHHHHHYNHHQMTWLNLNHEKQAEETTNNMEIQQHQQQGGDYDNYTKEAMFEKPLTPSDVGKLNRLVIPKQHAEKYFPLGSDDSMESGLLLSFEDELGKFWRFRYSYWNSSQSYVLTKGWSRYVKDKKLQSGDVVLFKRHRLNTDRLFISWRRRGTDPYDSSPHGNNHGLSNRGAYFLSHHHHDQQQQQQSYPVPLPLPLPYHQSSSHHGCVADKSRFMAPVVTKRQVRLFGVNLECQLEESSEPFSQDGSSQKVEANHDYYNNY